MMAATLAFTNPHPRRLFDRSSSGWNLNTTTSSFLPSTTAGSTQQLPHQPQFFSSQNGSERMEVDITDFVAGGDFATTTGPRKRKAETQENERLCKRVSLLNLEQNGERLYVPVESPTLSASLPRPSSTSSTSTSSTSPSRTHLSTTSLNPTLPLPPSSKDSDNVLEETNGSNMMRLDDTPHKVYIYDLDAELSSSSDSESEQTIKFLPDIERHLRTTRIPRSVLRADDEGKFAGKDAREMQLVLYGDGMPKSLSVPEEKDSVRRAILDARHRASEEQERVKERIREAQERVRGIYSGVAANGGGAGKETLNGMGMGGMAVNGFGKYAPVAAVPVQARPAGFSSGFAPAGGFQGTVYDDDAMDLDL